MQRVLACLTTFSGIYLSTPSSSSTKFSGITIPPPHQTPSISPNHFPQNPCDIYPVYLYPLSLQTRPFYTSIDSLNLKTPFPFNTPSIPSGSLGNGSPSRSTGAGCSVDLSVTSTRPSDLIALVSEGTMSWFSLVPRSSQKTRQGEERTYQKPTTRNQSHKIIILRNLHRLLHTRRAPPIALHSSFRTHYRRALAA